jgi:hypothetical protein
MGHLHPPMIRDWEQIAREYARLAAAPPEASERPKIECALCGTPVDEAVCMECYERNLDGG